MLLLIYTQHTAAHAEGRVAEPDPTYVAGFQQWRLLGRSVDKGQRGYMIYAPVGVATGPSGLVVVDLDQNGGHAAPERFAGARHGLDVLARLAAEAGADMPTNTYTVSTPGGLHLYYQAPDADVDVPDSFEFASGE